MRITREQAAANREKVLVAAARLFRKRGLAAVGIDAVAAEAGLTHGAIYSHFKSKDELAAAAIARAMQDSMDDWVELTRGVESSAAFERLLRAYVSRTHRNAPEEGCSIAALGGGAPREAKPLQDVFKDGVERLIEIVASVDGGEGAGRRERAIATAATMMGAIVMARATVSEPALSDEILGTVRRRLMAMR